VVEMDPHDAFANIKHPGSTVPRSAPPAHCQTIMMPFLVLRRRRKTEPQFHPNGCSSSFSSSPLSSCAYPLDCLPQNATTICDVVLESHPTVNRAIVKYRRSNCGVSKYFSINYCSSQRNRNKSLTSAARKRAIQWENNHPSKTPLGAACQCKMLNVEMFPQSEVDILWCALLFVVLAPRTIQSLRMPPIAPQFPIARASLAATIMNSTRELGFHPSASTKSGRRRNKRRFSIPMSSKSFSITRVFSSHLQGQYARGPGGPRWWQAMLSALAFCLIAAALIFSVGNKVEPQ